MPTCTICKRPESADRFGDYFEAVAENGMRLVHFWVCHECAIPLGPGQGPIADFRED